MKWDWSKFWKFIIDFIMNMFARPMSVAMTAKDLMQGKKKIVVLSKEKDHLPKDHPYYFPTREEWLKQNENKK